LSLPVGVAIDDLVGTEVIKVSIGWWSGSESALLVGKA